MPDAEAWRRGVAETFQAIVAREGITARHAAMRRVKSRFRDHVERWCAGSDPQEPQSDNAV